MLIADLSEGLPSPHLIHLNFISSFSYPTSAADLVVFLHELLVVVTQNVIAVSVVLHFLVFEKVIDRGIANLNCVTMLIIQLPFICFVFNALASAAENLDKEEQSDSAPNEYPVVEHEHKEIPFDILHWDLHEGKFLPVQVGVI